MIKFSTILLFSFIAGSAFGQLRMATQVPVGQVSRSSSGQPASGYKSTSSSYSGSASQGGGYSARATNNSSSYHASVGTSNTSSYYSGGGHDHYGRVLYANNTNTFTGRGEFLPSQRLELPRQEIAILVFDTYPLEVGGKTSDNGFRHSGLGFLAGTYPDAQTNNPPLFGNPQQPNFNPFFQSNPKLQNSDYNKNQFSFQCPLTGLNTGYLSTHRCNGCIGYYHYWRTYTNFGCFEYLNGQINKVASIDELKALIQSYYDCIDYYQQYNFLDPNTRGRYRYGVGH